MRRNDRPVYLNLLKIRLPLPGVVSFGHRISGVLLFLALPFLVAMMERALASPEGFAQAATWLRHPVAWPVWAVLAWSLAHHFLAGIRFLLIDLDVGVDRVGARAGAWLVLFGGLVLAVLLLWGLRS